jgi:hypothetical protein
MNTRVIDPFLDGPNPHWTRLAVGQAGLEWTPGRLRFEVQAATDRRLADAEIGDYRDRRRSKLPWRPPLRLAVRARFSHGSHELGGTAGFGFWNNPFDLGSGDAVAPPNALWFFQASPQSDMVTAPGHPGHGFRAEVINSGTLPGWLVTLGNRLLQLPGLAPLLYQVAQTQVRAGAVRLDEVDMTTWHDYVLFWSPSEAVFSVDSREVLRRPRPPAMPLGFVAWMDNQVAVARPDGEFRFGLEAVPGRQWLELAGVEIEMM